MKPVLLAAVILTCLPAGMILAATPPTDNLSVVLEKAVYAEETAGDLDAAGKLYRQIIDTAGANRPLAAQALQRLAMLQIKQGRPTDAQATVNKLKTDYAEQKEIIAKADEKLSRARSTLPEEIVRKMTDSAVDRVATMNEQDPKLSQTMAELEGLPEKYVVGQLTERLGSEVAEQRRASLYILWRGPLKDIATAIPGVTKLLSHEEELTRGMAALTLGGRKVSSTYQEIADMAATDKGAFARRCAVYALGLMGDARAIPVVEQAQKDSDPFVAANAKAAAAMLKQPAANPTTNTKAGAVTAADRRAAEQLGAAGWRLWGQRKLPEAEAQFKLAVEKDPANANNWNGLGWSQLNQGMKESARESFEKAVSLDPGASASWNGLGWIAKGEGKTDDAIKYWQKAIEATPAATAALSGLAGAYLEAGEYDKAEKCYQQWLKYEPANADAKAGSAKIKAARDAVTQAAKATESMLKDLDAGRYGEAWTQWSDFAKMQLPKDKFEALFPARLKPLGKVLERKRISAQYLTQIPGGPDGEYVVMQFETKFENKKDAIETITPMKDKDGVWRVGGYFIK